MTSGQESAQPKTVVRPPPDAVPPESRDKKQDLVSYRLVRFTHGRPATVVRSPHWQMADSPSTGVESLAADRPLLRPSQEWRAKRIIDMVGATALTLIFSPLMLAVAGALLATGGQVVYQPPRIGRDGKPFRMYKFRTMVVNADAKLEEFLARNPALRAEWNEKQKLLHDPRVTRFGRFLRHTSLDELPQLLNVIRGEMSLAGPRPVTHAELREHYGAAARYYIAVKPGITGLWQVSGRSDLTYQQRVNLDVHYVHYYTLWLDARILLRTIWVVLTGKGAH